jgi:hypothetical protein
MTILKSDEHEKSKSNSNHAIAPLVLIYYIERGVVVGRQLILTTCRLGRSTQLGKKLRGDLILKRVNTRTKGVIAHLRQCNASCFEKKEKIEKIHAEKTRKEDVLD